MTNQFERHYDRESDLIVIQEHDQAILAARVPDDFTFEIMKGWLLIKRKQRVLFKSGKLGPFYEPVIVRTHKDHDARVNALLNEYALHHKAGTATLTEPYIEFHTNNATVNIHADDKLRSFLFWLADNRRYTLSVQDLCDAAAEFESQYVPF